MNKFEEGLLKYLTEDELKKIESKTIGVAGLGGLGSNCLANLVRSGFNNFVIADFDKVEQSNLNRQFYFQDQIGNKKTDAIEKNLKKINPALKLIKHCIKIDDLNVTEIFKSCDIVVEAFDCAFSKAMIVEKLAKSKELIVLGSGLCGFGNSDEIKIHRIKDNLIVIGDLLSDSSKNPPLSPKVNLTAAKQADEVLCFVLGR